MNKFITIGFVTVLALLTTTISAQVVINDNVIYKPFIKTVMMRQMGTEAILPVLNLNRRETMELSFDDLDNDLKRYHYTFYHCTSDWMIDTDLTEIDYIEGIREGTIDQFAYSNNNTIPYNHFTLNFPADNMLPKISGNYILKVYIDDPSEVAFTRRFLVVETTPVAIVGRVNQSSVILEHFTKQEVDFEIQLNGFRVADPVREIKVVVTQNQRMDNAINSLKPRFIRGDVLDYNYDEENNFNGGNEYRNFDIKSFRSPTERIDRINYDNNGYSVLLLSDPLKTKKNYIYEKDLDGRRFVKNDDYATNSDIEADYAWVWFSLPMSEPIAAGEVFIAGMLTGYQFDEESRMIYDQTNKAYQKGLLLKQGYYNYIYLVKDGKSGKTDESFTEGNHWETENEYTVLVYFKPIGGNYTRLISVENIKKN